MRLKYLEKRRLLKFFYEAKMNDKVQSENWDIEIAALLNPTIKTEKLNIYLLEFLASGLIEWDEKRKNAYVISDKGIIYYSSSWWSKLNINQKISIILGTATIVIASATAIFVALYNCCPD